jgi:chorismate mutase/prephenate dehydratase
MKKPKSKNLETPEPSTAIAALRNEIDNIDQQLLQLLNRRLTVARDIGRLKHQEGGPIVDRQRESHILQRLNALNPGPLEQDTLGQIFAIIFSASRRVQIP